MSRKHYKQIADALNSNLVKGKRYSKPQIVLILANALRGTNPRYSSDRFYRAAMGATKARG